jgi:cytochrome c-type biogenesis protein CcmH
MNTRKHNQFWPIVGLALVLAAALAGMAAPAYAQNPSADEINEVAKKLSCPTCTGINVADCPTETCAQWRAKIGEMLSEGRSEPEILDYFAARYGDHVLQVPPKRGFFILVWVLPVIAILAGLAWLVHLLRGWSRQTAAPQGEHPQSAEAVAPSGAAAAGDDIEDEYLQRVQQDLERLS